MEEADVVRIVESSIAKKNESLLASMKSMLDHSLTDLKRSHADTADSHLKGIKKLKFDEPHRLKKKETRTSTGLILKLVTPLKKGKKHVRPVSLTKSTLLLRKVRNFYQRGRNTFFWPTSLTSDGR